MKWVCTPTNVVKSKQKRRGFFLSIIFYTNVIDYNLLSLINFISNTSSDTSGHASDDRREGFKLDFG